MGEVLMKTFRIIQFSRFEVRRRKSTSSSGFCSGTVVMSLACMLVFAMLSTTAAAQTKNNAMNSSTLLKSRAERLAEESVALEADKIIELLRQEPGLLLAVKKMLVRKAYEQGRILDPEDLTDDALFELLRADHNICVLATLEIEDRGYVRAKPTKAEIERQRELDARYGVVRTSAPTQTQTQASADSTKQKATTQEDAYW